MTAASIISDAILTDARRSIARKQLERGKADAARTIGAKAFGTDFASPSDRDRPWFDSEYGRGARYRVFSYKWDGDDWKKVRKQSGPMLLIDATQAARDMAAKIDCECLD